MVCNNVNDVCNELNVFRQDTSANGVSEYVKVLATLLRARTISVTDVCYKTLLMPNNNSMRSWKNKSGLVGVVKEHIKPLPVSIEKDQSKVESLTRTWSLPVHIKKLNAIVVIIPLVLSSGLVVKKSRKNTLNSNTR